MNALTTSLFESQLRVSLTKHVVPGEGENIGFLSAIPLGFGNRYTSTFGREKAIGDEFDKRVVAAITSLGGAGAASLIAVGDAFFPQRGEDDPPIEIEHRLSRAADTLGQELVKGIRILDPIFGSALEHNVHTQPTARKVIGQVTNLKEMVKKANINKDLGGMLSSNVPVAGQRLEMVKDPVYLAAASQANAILSMIEPHQRRISLLRAHNNQIKNMARDAQGNNITALGRRDMMRANATALSDIYAEMAQVLARAKEHIEKGLREQNIDADVDFSTLQPRSNPREQVTTKTR